MYRHFRAALAAATMAAAPALAAPSIHADPTGDFVPSYAGPHNADLDITGVGATFDGTTFTLTVKTVAAIGSLSPDSFFVWGINRGAGVPRLLFTGAPPSIRPDLDFDGVYLTQQDGSAVLGGLSFPPTFTLYPGVVTISGDTLTAVLPAALLPSTGFDPAHYQFTVWSHDPIDADTDPGNSRIADFSPTIQAQVPEPTTWALLIAGFGLAGSALRRRAPLSG